MASTSSAARGLSSSTPRRSRPMAFRGEHTRKLGDKLLEGIFLPVLLETALLAVEPAGMPRGVAHLMQKSPAERLDARELIALRNVDFVRAGKVERLIVQGLDNGAG